MCGHDQELLGDADEDEYVDGCEDNSSGDDFDMIENVS